MTKASSIGEAMIANIEAAIRGEPLQELPPLPEAVERRAAELVDVRLEHRRVRAVEMKDPSTGKFPARSVDAALAPWPSETAAQRQAREYLMGRKMALVLAGGVGAGKTTAATWVALEAGGTTPGFIRASALERRGRYSKSLEPWLETRSCLVIDDLGAEVLDGHGVFRSLLDETIDMFFGDRKRIVITTNLRPRRVGDGELQFAERYGARVASRLSEIGLWADCGTRDLRREPDLGLVTGDRP
jgi:DNA replication protein DnaC